MPGGRSALVMCVLLAVPVAGCASTPAAPAGPDPAVLNANIRFKPEGREVGRSRSDDGVLATSYVVGKNLVKPIDSGFTVVGGTFVPDLNRHPARPGFTPYLSYVGTHPDLSGATCHLTAWRKDAAPFELVLASSTVTYDPAKEVGVVITSDCKADAAAG